MKNRMRYAGSFFTLAHNKNITGTGVVCENNYLWSI